jgi:hypothetical protein
MLPLADAVPEIDCNPVNCIGRRNDARTTFNKSACSCACSACRL